MYLEDRMKRITRIMILAVGGVLLWCAAAYLGLNLLLWALRLVGANI
jgi:hypothetical protein